MTYHRDTDFGKPPAAVYTVKDMDTLIARVKDSITQLEEAIEELKKIAVGTGLIMDEDIEEVV